MPKVLKAKKIVKTKKQIKFTVDCSQPVDDGIMDAAILMVYEYRVRPEDKRFPDFVEAQWSKVAGALDALNGN